jgi:hypothetical protein
MSPTTKKVLIGAGILVGGVLVYRMRSAKAAETATKPASDSPPPADQPPPKEETAAQRALRLAQMKKAMRAQLSGMSILSGCCLGSLSGGFR